MTHQEARKLWVEALRSGKYQQGRKWLNLKGKFCCLGVACEALGIERHESESGMVAYGGIKDGCGAPKEAMDLLGLRDALGRIDDDRALFRFNDHEGLSFDEIADIIESEPPGLFID